MTETKSPALQTAVYLCGKLSTVPVKNLNVVFLNFVVGLVNIKAITSICGISTSQIFDSVGSISTVGL